MREWLRRIFVYVFLVTSLYGVDAKIKIEKDVESRAKIALIDASLERDDIFFDTLLKDLKISGHFLPKYDYRKGSFDTNVVPLDLKGAEYLLRYRLQSDLRGARLSVRLVNASEGKEIFAKSYAVTQAGKKPFLAHHAVSDINDALGYPSVAWLNRYVVFSRYTTPGKSEIGLADYTFRYQKTLIRGGLNLFPVWANEAQTKLYYSAMGKLTPTLYALDIYTGQKRRIAQSEGMIVCSDVDTKSGRILVTMAPDGQPDIYLLDQSSGATRLTTFRGIDVGGKFFAQGDELVFVSNRLGYPNIYKKGMRSLAVSQVVHHGRSNNAVDAFGTKIVYSSRETRNAFGSNRFNIYYADLATQERYPITTTGDNQFPRFSSDGSVVMYIKRTAAGSSVGYVNLRTKQSVLFPLHGIKIQSIHW